MLTTVWRSQMATTSDNSACSSKCLCNSASNLETWSDPVDGFRLPAKKNTWDGAKNPVKIMGINYIYLLTGAKFLPSTVSPISRVK